MRIKKAMGAGMLVCWAAVAGATSLARMSIGDMTQAAGRVARLRCDGNEMVRKGAEIWTLTRFEVMESWKGSGARQIVVLLPGGHAGHLISFVAGVPRYSPGEEVVLFLEPLRGGDYTVTAWGEGSFRIRRAASDGAEWAVRDSGGLILRRGGRETAQSSGGGGRQQLAELRAEVIAAQREEKR